MDIQRVALAAASSGQFGVQGAVILAAIKGEVHKKAMEKLAGENVVRDELAAGQSPREVFDRYGIRDIVIVGRL